MSFNSATGRFDGFPTQPGIFPVVVSATNAAGTTTATVTIVIDGPELPPIVAEATCAGTVGVALSYGFLTYGSGLATYTATDLPPGLKFDPSPYEKITGVPTTPGVYRVPISVTANSLTSNATVTFTIKEGKAPLITSPITSDGKVGSTFRYYIYGTEVPRSFAASDLPAGLVLDTATGIISGTPVAAGTYNVPISATNLTGTGTTVLTIIIEPGGADILIISAAMAAGTVGAPFSYAIKSDGAVTQFAATGLPMGLSLNASTGVISGTLAAAGTFSVALSATGPGGTGNAVLTLVIASASAPTPAPLITSAAGATTVLETGFTYTVTGTNSPNAYSAAGLPAGLVLDSSTGVISGMPTSSGIFPVVISATNAGGSGTGELSLKVLPAPDARPLILNSAGVNASLNQPFSLAINATNAPTAYAAEGLPPGLALDTITGLISGTPTTSGLSAVRVSASNAFGSGTAVLQFNVTATGTSPRITSVAAVNGLIGVHLRYYVTSDVAGYYFELESPLPVGLSLSRLSGQISGTPSEPGTTAVRVIARNTAKQVMATATITFDIAEGPLIAPAISSSAAASGYVGSDFRYAITGTQRPTVYSAESLPAGLAFDPFSGVISGRPTAAGRFSIPISASNTVGVGGAVLTVDILATTSVPVITSPAMAQGHKGHKGLKQVVYTIRATGGVASYSATGLPPGLSLDAIAGTVSGTPTQDGVFAAEIAASNGSGTARCIVTFTITKGSLPTIDSSLMLAGAIGESFSKTISASYGSKLTVGALPPGLAVDQKGRIGGIPTVAGRYSVPLVADGSERTRSVTLTIVIDSSPSAPVLSGPIWTVGSVGAALTLSSSAPSTAGPPTYSAAGLPPGLNISPGSGAITGVPTAAGVYTATITAVNSGGAASKVITIVVKPGTAPVISSPLGVSGLVGASLSYTATASYGPRTYSATGLPPGLSFSPATGWVTGYPTAAGIYDVTFTARSDAGTGVATVRFNIAATVGNLAPRITSAASVAVQTTISSNSGFSSTPAINYQITATNGVTRFGAVGLPDGLTINESTGYISGTPAVAGKYLVNISASNANGSTEAVLTIAVIATPRTIIGSANVIGFVDRSLSYAIRTSSDSFGSYPPFATTYDAESLPPGLSLDRYDGGITGVPAVQGTFPVRVSVTNAGGTITGIFTFVIRQSPTPTPPAKPEFYDLRAASAGAVGAPFSTRILAYGSPSTFTTGNLPPGLTLKLKPGTLNGESTIYGEISGTPTVAGSFTIPISAVNSAGTTNATMRMEISDRPGIPIISTPATLSATVGHQFDYRLEASTDPATPADAETYTASNLPPGLQLKPLTDFITGVPTATGTFSVPVSATVGAVSGTAVLTIVVADDTSSAPTITAVAGGIGYVGVPFSMNLTANRNPDSLSASSLPPGVNLLISDPTPAAPYTKAGKIQGIPTAPGLYTVPVVATNANGTANAVLTIRIIAPQVARPTITQHPLDLKVAIGQEAVFTAGAAGAPAVSYQWLKNGVPISGATAATLSIPAAAIADDASYRLRVTNLAGVVETTTAELAVIVGYDSWMNFQFTAEEIASGRAAALADFNRDGIANLLEYAFARDPQTGVGGELPTVSKIPGTNRVRIQFDRDARKPDLRYTVEASNDLISWIPIARSSGAEPTLNLGGAGSVVETGTGALRSVTVDDGSAGLGRAERFLRVTVERQ